MLNELIVLIWSARNPNTMGIFGNAKPVTIEADGESETKDVSEEFICGKEDGKWTSAEW